MFVLAKATRLFISLFGFSMIASKGLNLCVCPQCILWGVPAWQSMAVDWELEHHTSYLAEWFGLGFLSKRF